MIGVSILHGTNQCSQPPLRDLIQSTRRRAPVMAETVTQKPYHSKPWNADRNYIIQQKAWNLSIARRPNRLHRHLRMRWSGILWKDPTFDLSGTNPKSGLPPLRTSRTHGLEVKAPVEGFRLLKVAMEGIIGHKTASQSPLSSRYARFSSGAVSKAVAGLRRPPFQQWQNGGAKSRNSPRTLSFSSRLEPSMELMWQNFQHLRCPLSTVTS